MQVTTSNTAGFGYVRINSPERDMSIQKEFNESEADTIRRHMLRIQADIMKKSRRLAFLERALNEAQS
jgi:hypothetical protein